MKIKYFLWGILLCLMICGCVSEPPIGDKFYAIDVDIAGVNYTEIDYTGIKIDVPKEGTSFSVKAKGKYADRGYVQRIIEDDNVHRFTDNSPIDIDDVIEVNYESDNIPSRMHITVKPNTTGSQRVLWVELGDVKVKRRFHIFQE